MWPRSGCSPCVLSWDGGAEGDCILRMIVLGTTTILIHGHLKLLSSLGPLAVKWPASYGGQSGGRK
jgi:hypothetical protein